MRQWILRSVGASVFVLVILAPVASAQSAQGRARAGAGTRNAAPPPGPPHDPHDLNGVWLQSGPGLGGSGGGRPKLGSEWIQGELPLTPAGPLQEVLDYDTGKINYIGHAYGSRPSEKDPAGNIESEAIPPAEAPDADEPDSEED